MHERKDIRRIVIFVQQLEFMGGIERVVIEQIRIFQSRDCEVFLYTDRPVHVFSDRISCSQVVLPPERFEREMKLKELLGATRPDVMIFHGISHAYGKQDVDVATSCGVKTVCVVHFAFTGNIAGFGAGNSWRVFYENGLNCTAFATVSRIDSLFWRSLGVRAYHVQNPFVHPCFKGERRRDSADGVNLIWVGRRTEPKQPELALEVFRLVEKECSNVYLTMLGGTRNETNGKVTILAERSDINEYWQRADIHLLTSAWESFCLVWAEAKAAGIPTAMFELPYLDMAEDDKGYVSVPQGDVRGLADRIIRLVKDSDYRRRLGTEAKESLSRFNDDAVWDSWNDLFVALDDDASGREVDPDFKMFASQVYAALSYNKTNNRWPDMFVDDFRKLTRHSLRPLANLTHRLVQTLRRFRSF